MATAYFKIKLSLDTKAGKARLVPPKLLKDIDFGYVLVKEGGSEAIVKVDATSDAIKKIDNNKDFEKLTPKQMEAAIKNYPIAKKKRLYRPAKVEAGAEPQTGIYQKDEKGNLIVDTVQTVRSGYHLIDVVLRET